MAQILAKTDENKLRDLANGIARQIEEPNAVLKRLGFSSDEYQELAETRTFKVMLGQAVDEWEGAGNTHKRVKMKAAINIECALPHFYTAMTSDKEPLSSKVKAFEVISRVAGLGNPDPVASGPGQFFKLEINLGKGIAPLVLEGGRVDDQAEEVHGGGMTIDHEAVAASLAGIEFLEDEGEVDTPVPAEGHYSQSKLFDDLPLEEL